MHNIIITVPLHPRKTHRMTNQVHIKMPEGMEGRVKEYKDYIIDSIIDWFEEYDNQPKASQTHPL